MLESSEFDRKIFNGGSLIHLVPTVTLSNFKEFAKNVFVPFIHHEPARLNRADVV